MGSYRQKSDWQGSSPRMRGSLIVEGWPDGLYGIIPAHAGLTMM